MQRVLSLDIGTNSIGWAIVTSEIDSVIELDNGVVIFSDPLDNKENISLASKRRHTRQMRRQLFRKKMRKITLLRTLSKNRMCPVTEEEINTWFKENKIPVENEQFIDWTRMRFDRFKDNKEFLNVYRLRELAVNGEKLTPQELGRIFYHLAQRRGFKSSKKDLDQSKESQLEEEYKEKHGSKLLIEAIIDDVISGKRIRKGDKSGLEEERSYTRKQYEREFDEIVKKQKIRPELAQKIKDVIFMQRPLKSQKGLIGKCKFEPAKNRCYKSHPDFEIYRLFQKVNNIRKKLKDSPEPMDFIDDDDKYEIIVKMLNNKSGKKFGELRKIIDPDDQYIFNYKDDVKIDGCPTNKVLKTFFGDDHRKKSFTRIKKNGKAVSVNYEDIWHLLHFKTDIDKEKLKQYAMDVFGMDEKNAESFSKVKLEEGLSELSLKAIRLIKYFLLKRYSYDKSVLLAKIPDILDDIWETDENIILNDIDDIILQHKFDKALIDTINDYKARKINDGEKISGIKYEDFLKKLSYKFGRKLHDEIDSQYIKESIINAINELAKLDKYNRIHFSKCYRLSDKIAGYLIAEYKIPEKKAGTLYHPSEVEIFPVKISDDEILPKPLFASIKNPLFVRTMSILRKLITKLISEGMIDKSDTVIIETTRQLNSRNIKLAVEKINKNNEDARLNARKNIIKLYKENCGKDIDPSDEDITKYLLWKEQNHKCLYTGWDIGICYLLGEESIIHIEHTVPQSISYDNSMANKTVCFADYNTNRKGNKIPFALQNYNEHTEFRGKIIPPILENISFIHDKVSSLEKELEKLNKQKPAMPEDRDKLVVKKYMKREEYIYWKKKLNTFLIEDVEFNFVNRQLIDTSLLAKYSLNFLKKYFKRVVPVKARFIHDIKELYLNEKKDRSDHLHHTIDALFMCLAKDLILRNPYKLKLLKEYFGINTEIKAGISVQKNKNRQKGIQSQLLSVPNPQEMIQKVLNNTLVYHYHKDRTFVQTKKKKRIRGEVVYKQNANGAKVPVYEKGFGVRGELHSQNPFGKIIHDNEFKFVKRKSAGALTQGDLKNIADPFIREIILANYEKDKPYYEFENSGRKIKKVRLISKTKEPLSIRKHAYASDQEHKQYQYVENSSNYIMVFYENRENGKRDFELVKLIDYAQYVRDKISGESPDLPFSPYKKGADIKYLLKRHDKVLFFDDSPAELFKLDYNELSKRLYKIVGFEKDGRIKFHRHLLAAAAEITKEKQLTLKEHIDCYRIFRKNWNFLVEGIDFEMDMLGNIAFKNV
ncbi:MAG: type II CRISPR RNA-guided endonuclease Cas9 [Candidatus Kapaibacterium sp.]